MSGIPVNVPPVEGDLDGTTPPAGPAEKGADGLVERRLRDPVRVHPCGQVLVAEEATVGAAPVHEEKRDDHRDGPLSFSSSMAVLAACCSASFLLLPCPVAMTRSPTTRLVVNNLSWSGPVSEIRR